MAEWKPRHRRLFCFTITEKQKAGAGILYQPQANRGSMTEVQDVWILSAADDCKLGPWKRGMRCLIKDGFELEPVDLNLWDDYKEFSEFYDLKVEAARVEGKVRTTVISEASIEAVTEGV